MSKYKICVYAISKNEEKFVSRWVNSMKEADEIYVLDTGSSDHTREELKKYGVHVKKKIIKPWRFDVARNESLKMIPEDFDICVCTDLDEVFEEGWRKKLEELWDDETTRLAYNYNWSLDENNQPKVNFYIEKIHSRKNYQWEHPVHEVLTYVGNGFENKKTTDLITLNHYPDSNKSRSSYLPLLELSVKENPLDDRNIHYLGREYMYYGRYQEAIDTLIKHLSLKTATWKDERCASMRFIGRCYRFLERYKESEMWYKMAIKEAPYLRDSYMEMAILKYIEKDFRLVEHYVLLALDINSHPKTYINESFSFDATPYDLLSIAYYYLNKKDDALYYVNLALKKNPGDERLLDNKRKILEMN